MLPSQDLIELLVELFLIEKLSSGNPVHLRAQFRNTILIGDLHFSLSGDQTGKNIIAECEIGPRRQ
jgi:hypothetical protein